MIVRKKLSENDIDLAHQTAVMAFASLISNAAPTREHPVLGFRMYQAG